MLMCYGEAKGSTPEALRIYCQKYPRRNVPDRRIFTRLYQRLRDTGSVTGNRFGGRDQRDPHLEERVMRRIEENPSTSTRRIAAEERVSSTTVWRILKDNQLYPYHLQRVQEIEEGDFENRFHFCTWMMEMITADEGFLSKILFVDEANFNRNGSVNTRNSHVWAEENPHALLEINTQRQFSTNIWAGILGDKIIGPVVLPRRLGGQGYLEFLQTQLPALLEDVPLIVRRDMWYMQDGAPAHWAVIVRQHLNAYFGNRWIGREGPIAWPARSPDFNPLDFFYWGHMKNLVYSTPVATLDELQQRIQFTSGIVQNVMGDFRQVRENFRRRMQLCIQENGGHVEHLL